MEEIGYYYYINADKKFFNHFPFLCIAGTYSDYKKREQSSYVVIDYESLAVSKEQFIKFIKIMNLWGFPVILENLEEGFKCTFPNTKYLNDKHFLAAITIFRYTIKCYLMNADEFGTDYVISDMFEFKSKYPKLSYFQCFQLGCYKSMPGHHDQGHSCFKIVSRLVTHSEMRKKLTKNLPTSNSLYFKQELPEYRDATYYGNPAWENMHNLINEDEKAALKLLL